MKLMIFVFMFGAVFNLHAQLDESNIREKILFSIQEETEKRARELESKIFTLDSEIKKIDEALQNSENKEEIIQKLKTRVEKLEAIQAAQKQQERNVYDYNFQSAVINLISMERELKPLTLFNSSREFFSSLTSIGDPMNYDGYKKWWFNDFRKYLDKKRSSDAFLEITAKMLETVGEFSEGITIVGPLSDVLFTSIGKFIGSLGGNKDLKKKSEEMFQLTMILAQYTSDKNLIQTGWKNINKELDELQKLQESTLAEVLGLLQVDKGELNKKYIDENDALKRLDYLRKLRELIKEKVRLYQSNNTEGWKDKIYYQMVTVQSLKIRFGNITFEMSENIQLYENLIDKYRNDNLIGTKIEQLEGKLKHLSRTFNNAFNPQKYINDAVRMYKNN